MKYFSQTFFTLVFSWMILASAGWPQLVYAVSCNDVVDQASGTRYSDALTSFFYFGDKTYATVMPGNNYFAFDANITREYLLDGVDTNSLKKQIQTGVRYGDAKPLLLSSEAVRDFIVEYYGDALAVGNTYIDAWREYGTSTFTTMSGAALPFVDWLSTPAESTIPSAVLMDRSGKMLPATTGTATAQIVEFSGKLDCALDLNPTDPPPDDPDDPGDPTDPNAISGVVCSQDINNNGYVGEVGEIATCLDTPQGNFCPVGALDCGTTYQPPTCPDGSIMNYDRDMCQADHLSVTCPIGYAWDASLDRCTNIPSCEDGGVFNHMTDLCEKVIADTVCPADYQLITTTPFISFDPALSRPATSICVKPVSCSFGAYNSITNRCESSVLAASCPADMLYNTASARCESPPICPSGSSYNPAYDSCMKPVMACANGYTWNATRQRCEKQPPECPIGTTYNYTLNKCESAATPAAGCTTCDTANGYSWDGTTCVKSYAANVSTSCFPSPVPCLGPTVFNETSCYVNSSFCDGVWYTGGVYSINTTYTCPSGGTLSGTTCTVTAAPVCSNYAATCTGGEGFYTPVYRNADTLMLSAPQYPLVGYCATTNAGSLSHFQTTGAFGIPAVDIYVFPGPPQVSSLGVSVAYSAWGSTVIFNNVAPGGYIPTSPGTYGQTCSCPSGGTLSGTTCVFGEATCADGSTPVNGVCQANPTCTGGALDGANDVCYYAATACEDGWSYDSATGQCMQAPTCAGGILDTVSDQCVLEIGSSSCPDGYTQDPSSGICYTAPICTTGAYVQASNRCEAAVTRSCGATYIWDAVVEKCVHAPTCPADPNYSLSSTIAYSPNLDKCISQAMHTCPGGTTWATLPISKCEAAPICEGAVYYDATANQCLISAACPYGPQFTCMQNPNSGGFQCSPNPCVDTGGGGDVDITDPQDPTYYDDDGDRDADGNCLGTVYIFSGKPGRCRPPGWTVGMINNCCDKGDVMPENTGSSLGLMSSMYDLAKMASAMYQAAQGWAMYTNAVNNFNYTPTQAMDLVLSNLTTSVNNGAMTASQAATQVAGAQAAQAGASQATAMADAAINAGKNLAAAAISYAVGAIIKALGGDQDAVMVGSVSTTAMLAMFTSLLAGPQAIVGIILIVIMRVLMGSGCEPIDIITSGQVKSGRCHFVGDYCEKQWALVGCVQQAKGYCCFNSMLARIINEQGRPQLSVFGPTGGWGEANKPECRGLTPDEFQALDFQRIDLSEYFDVVQKDLDAKIQASQQNITNSIQRRFQDIQGVPAN